MKKNTLLFCLILCVYSCKEDAPTSLPGNEYVNEFMSLEPESLINDGDDSWWEERLRLFLPYFEGYYTATYDYLKTKRSSQIDAKIRLVLTFGEFDCSIRDVRDIKERVGYANDELTIYKFKEDSFVKKVYNPFLNEDRDVTFSVRAEGLYSQSTYGDGAYKDESIRVPFTGDFQIKYRSKKGTDFVYEDLTYTTDNTETFTYTQTGNEILMVNEERQIKGVVSSDYKTISLTQISPNTQEIGTFNYK